MADASDNALISTRPSDSGLHVALHPLVLLTISDYATRHAARQQTGPIVGAILGQQQGRQITLEHAFDCHTITNPDNKIVLDSSWFASRVQQCTLYHIFQNLHDVIDNFLTVCRGYSSRCSQSPSSGHSWMVYFDA
jgi:COP9 signalosome complex subunit 6